MVLVSVVIPVYNMEKYVAEAIDSVLSQTFRDFEVIVVDDGSTDGSPAVLAAYGNRVRVIRQTNRGGAAATNIGIHRARGRWISWLSADDVWEPTKLERQVEIVSARPDVGMVYTDYVYVDPEGIVLSGEHFPCPSTRTRRLLWLARRCFINASSTLIRKDVFHRVGLYDETDRLTPDWDLWFRIALDYEIVHVPEPLVQYRIHPEQTSARRDLMERSARRVFSRNLRRMGPAIGALAALLGLIRQLRSFPAFVRESVGHGRNVTTQLKDFLEWGAILVNPQTTLAEQS